MGFNPGFSSSSPELSPDMVCGQCLTAAALTRHLPDTELHVTTFHQKQQTNDSRWVPHSSMGTLCGCSSSTSPGDQEFLE